MFKIEDLKQKLKQFEKDNQSLLEKNEMMSKIYFIEENYGEKSRSLLYENENLLKENSTLMQKSKLNSQRSSR